MFKTSKIGTVANVFVTSTDKYEATIPNPKVVQAILIVYILRFLSKPIPGKIFNF